MKQIKHEVSMNRKMLETFKSPDSRFRGKPFWAWNGKLDPVELKRQIRIMKRMGLGGFFMHSRVGLDTAYLSDEWFQCVDACVDEARRQKMEAWLYDEDRWPSGAAGGLVTRKPEYRMRHLAVRVMNSADEFKWTSDCHGAFAARIQGATARDVRRLARNRKPTLSKGEKLVAFVLEVDSCSDWYNGYTYLDTMNHEAVGEFIRVTYQAYFKRYGKEFGRRIPGIFTDEPNFGRKLGGKDASAPGNLPWTGQLPEVFKKRYGYDLLPNLMELVYDVDDKKMSSARYHYHDCVTHLYVDAFCRQIGEWCGKHNIRFTGHQLEEDSLRSQTNAIGSSLRTYEYMQAPGMDLLTEHWRVFNTAKQVSSAARQFGASWRLTETYGCTGWDFPFEGHKALGDWQVALGINLRCQHLSWYTMEGQAKRDYPAAIFYQSPWWPFYDKVEDYFGRVLSVMTRGREVRDLLVIHPVESMWTLVKQGWQQRPETGALDQSFQKISEILLAAHLDFDFGDEELMSRHAKTGKSRGRAVLRVGEASYKAVLVPPMKTMRGSTLERLQAFAEAGGKVVFAGETAAAVNAEESDAVVNLADHCIRVNESGPEIVTALEKDTRRISIADAGNREIAPALYLLREDAGAYYLFVCNTGEDFIASPTPLQSQPMVRDRKLSFEDVRIRGLSDALGEPVELCPESGDVSKVDFSRDRNGLEIRTHLPALGSRLFVFPKKRGPFAAVTAPTPTNAGKAEALQGDEWEIDLSENSNLVLDRPRFRIDSGNWNPAGEILRVDRKVRDALGIPHRGGQMVQPWARKTPSSPKRVKVELLYTFHCEARPTGDLFLAMERPETFHAEMNGHEVSRETECGWWVDRSLRKLRLDPSDLKTGRNELRLVCDYSETHSGLEIVYLLGHFGSSVKGTKVTMTALPRVLRTGDWTKQGLAFYAGSVTYRRQVSVPAAAAGGKVLLRLTEFRGTAARVLVNGTEAGAVAWPPYEIDLSKWQGRDIELQIQIIGHRRNSHGPLHLSVKWPSWTGPAEFTTTGAAWRESYQLVPCGLLKNPQWVIL